MEKLEQKIETVELQCGSIYNVDPQTKKLYANDQYMKTLPSIADQINYLFGIGMTEDKYKPYIRK